MKRVLITSAIPYVAGVKHLGNLVGSMLPADIFARYCRSRGYDTLAICATDEHGAPVELAALEEGTPVAEYAAKWHAVQKELGDKVGRDVHFISISVDPATDTPERLKAWGAKFKAGAGWTFVTGEKQEMDKLLDALGAAVAKREDHTPAMIIGNDAKGVWTRTYGLAKTGQIVGLILDVMNGKVDEPATSQEAKP